MAKLTYSEQLRHPNWQRKRLEALQRSDFTCERCDDKETTLNVHHRRYVKGRLAWEYDLSDLCVLCEPCHAVEHDERALIDWIIADACSFRGAEAISEAIGLLSGYFSALASLDPGIAHMGEESSGLHQEIGFAAAALFVGKRGRDGWRDVVRAQVKDGPAAAPDLCRIVELWEDDDK